MVFLEFDMLHENILELSWDMVGENSIPQI